MAYITPYTEVTSLPDTLTIVVPSVLLTTIRSPGDNIKLVLSKIPPLAGMIAPFSIYSLLSGVSSVDTATCIVISVVSVFKIFNVTSE